MSWKNHQIVELIDNKRGLILSLNENEAQVLILDEVSNIEAGIELTPDSQTDQQVHLSFDGSVGDWISS